MIEKLRWGAFWGLLPFTLAALLLALALGGLAGLGLSLCPRLQAAFQRFATRGWPCDES